MIRHHVFGFDCSGRQQRVGQLLSCAHLVSYTDDVDTTLLCREVLCTSHREARCKESCLGGRLTDNVRPNSDQDAVQQQDKCTNKEHKHSISIESKVTQ